MEVLQPKRRMLCSRQRAGGWKNRYTGVFQGLGNNNRKRAQRSATGAAAVVSVQYFPLAPPAE